MKRLESLTEKMIREAIENGELDNLPGKGEPIDLSENPFEDPDLRTVHRLLRNAGFAPAWIEERKDIEATAEAAKLQLQRAWELYGSKSQDDANWRRNLSEFEKKVEELNDRTRIYNLKAPATVFHRRVMDAKRVVNEIVNPTRGNQGR